MTFYELLKSNILVYPIYEVCDRHTGVAQLFNDPDTLVLFQQECHIGYNFLPFKVLGVLPHGCHAYDIIVDSRKGE